MLGFLCYLFSMFSVYKHYKYNGYKKNRCKPCQSVVIVPFEHILKCLAMLGNQSVVVF